MTLSTTRALAEPRVTRWSVPEETLPNASLYASQTYFDAEMEALRASSWQFFCITDDLAQANDWVRRKVFGVDIFVQNFVGDLRGYHNVCQHRGFPLRREPRGNGRVQCRFHGWVYDPSGVPVGVPRNKELFDLSREQQAERAIPRVRVATVGRFVFVALRESAPPIETFLGRYGALLEAVSHRMGGLRHRWNGLTKANWKLSYEVTLDDYHVSFVHPSTLGATPAPAENLFYDREGHHSHLFGRRDADWTFAAFWEDVANRNFDFTGYKVHHLFPNLLLVASYRIISITLFSPREPAATEVDDLIFDLQGDEVDEADGRSCAPITERFPPRIARFRRASRRRSPSSRVGRFSEPWKSASPGSTKATKSWSEPRQGDLCVR